MDKLQEKQLNEILEQVGGSLDISQSTHEQLVSSYQAVGEQLIKENSELIPYNPEILPQGSFMLGTMTKPINPDDDLDIDLVCQLTRKQDSWTQEDVKQKVGDQLKDNKTYLKMIKKPEGRRCWTLVYAEDSNYHMDILPCVVDSNYKILLESVFSSHELNDINELAIRITDKEMDGYDWETNHLNWLKSNPFGYARWFFYQAVIDADKSTFVNESIQPVKKFEKDKLPLQRVVQILKRHRDIMFNGDEHKPISIIITTLAARAYQKEESIIEALQNIVGRMSSFVQSEYSMEHGKYIKYVKNPVNDDENFADKWPEEPIKELNFYKWLDKLQSDLRNILDNLGLGINELKRPFSTAFGDSLITETFKNYGTALEAKRNEGGVKMAGLTGMLGDVGTTVKKHNFEGTNGEKD